MSTNTYIEGLHREVREELTRVDSKIATLLAVFGIAVSIVAGAMITGDADPTTLRGIHEAAFWASATLSVAAVAVLVATLHPVVIHHEDCMQLRYYGHVVQFDDYDAFRAALHGSERDEARRIEEQTYTLSRIVARKYAWTSRAVYVYTVAVICGLIAAAGS
jgi:hypothetical protein